MRKDGMKMKRIYIYGAGGYGRSALDFFNCHDSLKLISGIIDNNPGLNGSVIFGKLIVSYKDIKNELDSNSTIIICVELETALSISKELKSDQKIRYLYWSCEQDKSFDELLSLVEMDDDYRLFSHSLLYEIEIFDRQKKYLLDNYEPRFFKTAQGDLRNRQLKLVEFANEIVSEVGNDIHPFVSSGNLLGYVRHEGFIPWDDDFDFTILRTEYVKMRSVLMEKYYYSRYSGPFNDDNEQLKWIKREMDAHQGETVLLERPMLFRACKKVGDEYLLVDFFPLDEFIDESDYQKRLEVLQTNKSLLSGVTNVDDYYNVIKKIDSDDTVFRMIGGPYLGYGYDVRESYSGSKYNRFIERKYVFPLKEILFEGKKFEAPNNPEEYLRFEFGNNYMEFPQSIGLHFSTDIFNSIS